MKRRLLFSFFILCTCPLWCFDSYEVVSAYWDGQTFHNCNLKQIPSNTRVVNGTTVYVSAGAITCYGHALLDGIFPLYVLLRNYDLLKTPINFAIEVNSSVKRHATFNNILKLIKDIFQVKEVILLHNDQHHDRPVFEKLILNQHVPYLGAQACSGELSAENFTKKFKKLARRARVPVKPGRHFSRDGLGQPKRFFPMPRVY